MEFMKSPSLAQLSSLALQSPHPSDGYTPSSSMVFSCFYPQKFPQLQYRLSFQCLSKRQPNHTPPMIIPQHSPGRVSQGLAPGHPVGNSSHRPLWGVALHSQAGPQRQG